MKALDDILIGFFIFFAIDRAIRLFSNAVVEPRMTARGASKETVENWKIGTEMVLLFACIFLVIRFRKPLSQINKM
jgi:hypothetical protein